jgi:PAS domain S-box-containing protein/putative nucleotidyltransferase with HDIG domain
MYIRSRNMEKKILGSVVHITAWYALFGGLWIAVSDRVLEALAVDPHRITVLQTYKGWAFVAASALLIAFLIGRELRERGIVEKRLQREQDRARMYLDVAGVILLAIGRDERVTLINRKGVEVLGQPEEEIADRNWFDTFVPERSRVEARAMFRRLVAGESGAGEAADSPVISKDGREHRITWHHAPVRDSAGGIIGVLSSGEDVTSRRRTEEQAACRLDQLATLHAIDLMITSTQDLRVILKQFIDLVIAQFRVDAADVLLVNRYAPSLEFAVEAGFRSVGIRRSALRIGEGLAGRAALERRFIRVPDLRDPGSGFLRTHLVEGEEFVAYYAMPLVAKGIVKGVLELMHRTPLLLDREQEDFLASMASQAAIAIDNATLFDEIQRSNIDLMLAYDATLEGWARALELRDRVTERHTERVAEMTVSIARAMGVREEEIVHFRRGALLHDIGKIGIPDNILRKEGPLTDDEREIMKRHPVLAFDMLRPIAYLRPALDIPYCHHEQWDGNGYPRGLKGEHIPLAARIFALADIWDAILSSDRTYRSPLSRRQACEHIRGLAGTHLDPKVVDMFLNMEDHYCPAGPVERENEAGVG